MDKQEIDPTTEWGKRFRHHVKKTAHMKWSDVAAKTGWAESTIRSWTNGTRPIQLDEFLKLCRATHADPAQILFGAATINPRQRDLLRTIVNEFGRRTH